VQASHSIVPVFDDPNLVSAAGLSPVLALGDRAGLSGLLAKHFSVPGGNAGVKVRSVVAGMLAGADDIDGLDVLRAGGMARLLGTVRAPSTIGTFLRSLTYGHCLQLGAVNRRLVAGLDRVVPSLISSQGPVLVDLDDTMREVHGYQKQAVAYGYNKTKGLNAILATISTDHSAPVIAQCGLRRGNIRSGAKSGWHAERALPLAREVAGDRPVLLRADSAFCMHQIVKAAQKAGCWFSLTIPAWKTVTRAISEIREEAWQAIEYPHAVFDDEAGQWISDAEVAEIPFTAFTSRPQAEHVTCRLVVRRVKRLGGAAWAGQDELFATYRYHAFITNSTLTAVDADRRHRGHAIVEQVIAELKGGPLAHLPSKSFSANMAWLACAVLAFNLSRAAAHAAGIGKARMATIATTIIRVPGRLASRSRKLIVHLPRNWPAKQQWMRLHATANAPPPATTP